MKIKVLVAFIVLLLAFTVFADECQGQVIYVPVHTEVDSTEAEKAEAYLQKIAEGAYKKDEKRKKIYKTIKYAVVAIGVIKIVRRNTK